MMDLNLIGKSPTEIGFQMFTTKRAALEAATMAGAKRPMAIPACNRFSRFWLAIDAVGGPDNPPVRMITWLDYNGQWSSHAHPGYVSGGKRVAAM